VSDSRKVTGTDIGTGRKCVAEISKRFRKILRHEIWLVTTAAQVRALNQSSLCRKLARRRV